MFCHNCGAKAIEGADFCQKCGAKLIKDLESQSGTEPMVAPTLKPAETATMSDDPMTPPAETPPQSKSQQSLVWESHVRDELDQGSVELVVTCAKLKGFFPGTIFPLLLDGVQVGDLPNNGTFTFRITPGSHQIKVGNVTIGINIPEGETTVALKLQPGPSKALELVCNPSHIVTVPSSIERATRQDMRRDLNATVVVGLVCFVLGIIGFIVGVMIPIDYPTMDYAISVLVSAILLIAAGGVFLILSPKTKRLKAKKAVLGLVSAIAVGAIIVIVSSTVLFINWNRMIYIDAVKNTRPFDTVENRQDWSNISYAYSFSTPNYDAVLSNYIDPIEWRTVDRDLGMVDVIGTIEGSGEQITIHFSGNAGSPYEIILDETSLTNDEDIYAFLYAMFDAYVKDEKFYPGGFLSDDSSITGNISNTPTNQVLLGGIPIQNVFELTEDEAQTTFGKPDMYIGPDCFKYGEDDSSEFMSFWIDSNNYVDSIAATPEKFTYNGRTFDVTYGDLEELLGVNLESLGASGYKAIINDCLFEFYIPKDTDRVERVDVSQANPNSNDVHLDLTYDGVSLTDWIGGPADIAYDIFGWPDYGTIIDESLYEGGEYFGYDFGFDSGITFVVDYRTNGIGWIWGDAGVIECNGVTLDKTRTELIAMLGTPIEEENVYDETQDISYYTMRYILNDTIVDIVMADSTSVAYTVSVSQMGS